jgi:hypothetical protein
MLALALALQLLVQEPVAPAPGSEWMDPAALGLCIGMTRGDVENAVDRARLQHEPGKYPRQIVVRYSETKNIMLQFVDDRLQSARYELVDFIPAVRKAYGDRVAAIEKSVGYEAARQKGDRAVLLYNKATPNVMVVLSTVPDDDFGKQGLGFLAIRWFDPSAEQVPR